jgi:hypothetical protein
LKYIAQDIKAAAPHLSLIHFRTQKPLSMIVISPDYDASLPLDTLLLNGRKLSTYPVGL